MYVVTGKSYKTVKLSSNFSCCLTGPHSVANGHCCFEMNGIMAVTGGVNGALDMRFNYYHRESVQAYSYCVSCNCCHLFTK